MIHVFLLLACLRSVGVEILEKRKHYTYSLLLYFVIK